MKKKSNLLTHLKLFIAIALLLCLLPMPYGYYTLVRLGSSIAFAYFAFKYFSKRATQWAWTFCVAALLFQPFYKIVLGRGLWNIVDAILAGVLLYLYYKEYLHRRL